MAGAIVLATAIDRAVVPGCAADGKKARAAADKFNGGGTPKIAGQSAEQRGATADAIGK